MRETEAQKAIVKLYDWISSERQSHFNLWEKTEDPGMKMYYGEKTSTYTSIKLYMLKYMSSVIYPQKNEEKRKHGL